MSYELLFDSGRDINYNVIEHMTQDQRLETFDHQHARQSLNH